MRFRGPLPLLGDEIEVRIPVGLNFVLMLGYNAPIVGHFLVHLVQLIRDNSVVWW